MKTTILSRFSLLLMAAAMFTACTTPEESETPAIPDVPATEAEIRTLLTAHPWKMVKQVFHYPENPQTDREVRPKGSGIGYVNANGTITMGEQTINYTLSGNNITLYIPGDYETPIPAIFAITKLTDSELIFSGEFQGQSQSVTVDENGNEIEGEITYYPYTWTWYLVKP